MTDKWHFDGLATSYSAFVSSDPIRNELHYPAIIKATNPASHAAVLDIGCGDGTFCRLIAQIGCKRVVGVDVSPTLIAEANHPSQTNSAISYFVSDIAELALDQRFDLVTSIMVLPYARDRGALDVFFAQAYEHLRPGGEFVSIIFDPAFSHFGTPVANRCFVKDPASENVTVQFLHPTTCVIQFTSVLKQFSWQNYESSSQKAGFTMHRWECLPTPNNSHFWQGCAATNPYTMFISTRPNPAVHGDCSVSLRDC